jgi:alpha/beta superfamily hydrolase
MHATPIWFGPEDRPLLGWFHSPPEGRARAGVVVCPPIGRDYLQAHYALRMLAEKLAELGLCVLRFDYDGTGDSAGDDNDPDRVASWMASVRSALGVVREVGPISLSMVGMRLGATLAGMVAEHEEGIDSLVLWDPPVSGGAYLTEQRALRALSSTIQSPMPDGAVEAPGMVFAPATARELRSIDLTRTAGPLARRLLVLTRPGRSVGRLAQRLAMPHVEWADATGQAELMDFGPPEQALPLDTIVRVATWVADIAPAQAQTIQLPPPAGSAVVAHTPSGEAVTETPAFVAPKGLFGILCEAGGSGPGPTVLFLSVAGEHRMGPCRLWVDLSRQWAAAGLRCFRIDLSSLGDSPLRHPDQPRFKALGVEAFDDVADAMRFLCPDDPSNIVLVGLCSSAYQALESAFATHPRGVVAVQPVLSLRPREMAMGRPMDPRRRIAMPRNTLVQAFHSDGPLSGLRRRFPDLGWRIRLWAAPRRRPGAWLRQLNQEGVDLLLICGEWEGRAIRQGASPGMLKRLGRTGRFRFEYHPELQHGLLIASQRTAVVETVTEYVIEHFGPPRPARSGHSRGTEPARDVVDQPAAPELVPAPGGPTRGVCPPTRSHFAERSIRRST